MKISLEKIKPSHENSSLSWMINPKLNDFFFWHFHPEMELVFIETQSGGTRHVGEHISRYVYNDFVFIGSNIPHLNFDYGIKESYSKTVLHIKPDFLALANETTPELNGIKSLIEKSKYGISFGREIMNSLGENFKILHRLPYFEQFLEIIKLLNALGETEDYELLHSEIPKNQYNRKEQDRLTNIFEFIDHSYQRKIELTEIARVANLSNPAFCRYFRKMTKLSFTEFLNHYRINHAKRLLLLDNNVSEVCFECGFESLSYFNRIFKKITGINPLAFKKKF